MYHVYCSSAWTSADNVGSKIIALTARAFNFGTIDVDSDSKIGTQRRRNCTTQLRIIKQTQEVELRQISQNR